MAGMNRSVPVQVRFTPEEAEMLRKAAAHENQTVSEYVRICVVRVRGIEGDPVAWAVIRKNVQEAIAEIFPPARRKKLA